MLFAALRRLNGGCPTPYLLEIQRNLPENKAELKEFIRRDADDADHKNGQHVTDAFHEADFFVDNTPDIPMPESGDLKDATDDRLIGELSRLLSIILHDRIHRPSIDETAMHTAYSAQLQSSCLSRQVGAALVDKRGNIVATGTNEVPKAGGGVYGEDTAPGGVENRCAFCDNGGEGPFCSNNTEQNALIEDVLKTLFGNEILPDELQQKLITVRKTPLGGLLEFSRWVHAEMDEYHTSQSVGSEQGQANSAVPTSIDVGKSPASSGKVLFKPFVGVAPRLYSRIFRKYKDKVTGAFSIRDAEWGYSWSQHQVSYASLELQIIMQVAADG